MKDIVLIGGGGHCKAVIDVVEQEGRFNIIGIIDLSNACNDFLCYDLSICINAWCYDKKLNIDKMINLIKGYNSIRKMKMQEINYC